MRPRVAGPHIVQRKLLVMLYQRREDLLLIAGAPASGVFAGTSGKQVIYLRAREKLCIHDQVNNVAFMRHSLKFHFSACCSQIAVVAQHSWQQASC